MALRYLPPFPTLRHISENINLMLRGRGNNSGQVTLTVSATTTSVSDTNIHSGSTIYLTPRTANAAAIVASLYVSSVTDGGFTLTHPSNANADKTFDYIYVG